MNSEKKIIYSSNIDAKEGSFALDGSPLRFEHCRERFGKMWDDQTEGWFFKHCPNAGDNIIAFMQKTEGILKQSEFSTFSYTNRDTILWIQPSRFWKSCRMRRSLLTILVRVAMLYDLKNDNYEEILFNHEYIAPTKKAIQRFLFGFTKFVGNIDNISTLEKIGWKSVFEGKNTETIKTFLVWPNHDEPYKPAFRGKENLWF